MWGVAQLHLNFAAFILGVPIFAVIIEIIAWRSQEARYDWLAHEFVKLIFAAFSATALLAALGVVGLELWGLRWARRRARR